MGYLPRLLLFKQCLTKPTFSFLQSSKVPFAKPPTQTTHLFMNSVLLQTRSCSSETPTSRFNKPFISEVVRMAAKSPESSVVSLLDQYHKDGSPITLRDLRTVVRRLRRHKRLDRALEVSEWMASNLSSDPSSGDLAAQLSLIGEAHGVDAAERFFREVDVHTEKMYGALLNCYVQANLVDKSLSHFRKMKEMGLAMSPLAYNNLMTLYINIGQVEKIPELLSEMEDIGVSPDNYSYRACFRSFALRSDFSSMEKLVDRMEHQKGLTIEWLTYAAIASHYIEGGFKDKAVQFLQKAEGRVRDNPVGYNTLFTNYARLEDLNKVMSLWQKRKTACKPPMNADYIAVIVSLIKLDEFQEAERVLQEWESSGVFYDFRIPNAILLGYTQKGQVDKAEKMLAEIIRKGNKPLPNTWSIISAGHIRCQNMDKALQTMKKALILGPENKGWFPNPEAISSILKWLGDNAEVTIVDEFLYLLSRVLPMDKEMYQTLLRANIRHGNNVDDILQSMKESNIDVDEETMKMINSPTGS